MGDLKRAVGDVIRVEREALGLSQKDFADRAGCGKSLVGRLELGQSMTVDNLAMIAPHLGRSVWQLFAAAEGSAQPDRPTETAGDLEPFEVAILNEYRRDGEPAVVALCVAALRRRATPRSRE